MKELLLAIQTQLRTDLTYIRDRDIYIAPHINYIPASVRPPCVGIKDGKPTRVEGAASTWEVTLPVIIAVYVQLAKEEANIIGDASTNKKGVLEIAEDVMSSLDENLLSITGMEAAICLEDNESELFGDEKESMQRKILPFQYIKTETRPG